MKTNTKNLIFGLVLGLILGIIIGYFMGTSFNNKNSFGIPGNFEGGSGRMQMLELTDNEILEIKSFFESSPSDSEIENYCLEKMNFCMYYCKEIDSKNDYCNKLNIPFNPAK